MDYLTQGYGWNFAKVKSSDGENGELENEAQEKETIQLQQMPMQPFSEENYLTTNTSPLVKASFDANWFKLSQNSQSTELEHDRTLVIQDDTLALASLTANDLIRFFQHPSKMFAQQALNLYLEPNKVELDDVEPFSTDYLESYLLKQQLLLATLANESANELSVSFAPLSTEDVLHAAKLSGRFPDLPTTQASFDTWLDDTALFSHRHRCQTPPSI